ncbi:segregation/condensation protein A [Methanoplanus sp. FWC-SCC4]|uniref:Segregation/condensation protein A n=1 Tax=Methanochimaera problematica TaxID=2609417 RepID=A0AA97FBT7_9EURY|nr:ScpA family protein [Methanoplanus sp. FWC-SCC4]WOF16535.1 segregation/condensation protein A [Methanoplanus sp. FWC-SCC4]
MDEEPVEILVRMAESGEIDPWNINIVEVTDRFLNELDRMQKLDLRVSGRTLFYASFLLRMKSEYLEESPDDVCDGEYYDEDFEYESDSGDESFSFDDFAEPVERLEREIQRRINRKSQRKRLVTLYELIKELKTAEKMQRRKQRRKESLPILHVEAEDVVSVAHEEDFQKSADTIFACYRDLVKERGAVTLGDICKKTGSDMRSAYIPLLFLMLEGKLMIFQDEFFGEIKISDWSPEKFEEDKVPE